MTAPAHVLVTAGTGKTGSRIAQSLAERGIQVRIGSRRGRPPFDQDDPSTWDAALDEVDALYLVYVPDIAVPSAAASVGGLARAAADRGIERAVVLSGRGEPGTHAAEQAVRAAIPTATVVRSSWFAQNLTESFLHDAVLEGTIALPGRDVPEPFIDLRDLTDVVVAALITDDHAGATLEVTGPRLVRFSEVSECISTATGRPVTYRTVSTEQYRAGAVAAGMDPLEAEALAELFAFVLDGHNAHTTGTVLRLLGRPARDIADLIDEAAADGVWSAAGTRS